MTISFELDGKTFMALNGGPHYKFSEAVSFVIDCKTQEEVDAYWGKLSAGGEESQCGWLKDKFGVSWQVVPTILGELMSDPDPKKAGRVVEAMMRMGKLQIDVLKKAYQGA